MKTCLIEGCNRKYLAKGFCRNHYKTNRQTKKSRRKWFYRKKYDLSLEQVEEMLIKQEHKCKICGKSLTDKNRNIDHSHKTGKVRGILCIRCNHRLGFFEDGDFLRKATIYLMLNGETVFDSWDIT